MPFLIISVILLPFTIWTAGKNFDKLWKGALIGVGIMVVADTTGHLLNLYHYQNGLIMLGGFLPVIQILNIFISSVLYLNWLPRHWSKRLLYTAYVSVLFLALEAIIFQAGAIVYTNWMLLYSYILNIAGLSLLAYLSDKAFQRI